MTAAGEIIIAGIVVAAIAVARLIRRDEIDVFGDWPRIHPEMTAAGSNLYRAGGGAEDGARRRPKRIQETSHNHSGERF